MNEQDPFEQRLRRQPLRRVPAAWREEILASARAAAEASGRSLTEEAIGDDRVALFAGWRLLFVRLPLAWTSLAALWVTLIGVNLMLHGPVVTVVAQTSPSLQMESLKALDLTWLEPESPEDHRMSEPGVLPTRKVPDPVHRPHSERRLDVEPGKVRSEWRFRATV